MLGKCLACGILYIEYLGAVMHACYPSSQETEAGG